MRLTLTTMLATAVLAAFVPAAVGAPRREDVARQRAQQFYKDARGYVATYDFGPALGSVRQAETFDPGALEIRAYRERLEKAAEAFPDRLFRDESSHVFREGVAKYVAAEYDTALLCLGATLGAKPLDEPLQRFIRRVEQETGRALPPEDIHPPKELAALKLERAADAFDANRYAQAALLCQQAVVLEPDNALAYTRLGSVYYAAEDFARAKDAWTQALALKPGDAEIKKYLAEIKKKPQEAR